jgi:hypothetical protein
MKGFAFIWLFLVKVRESIENNRASSQAFVSLRLMINVKYTYVAYREILDGSAQPKGKVTNDAISKPKTIIESMDTFFGLFKEATREAILNDVKYDDFKKIVDKKNAMPYNSKEPDFDTPKELEEVRLKVDEYESKQKTI